MKISRPRIIGERVVVRVLLCLLLLGGSVWPSSGFAAEKSAMSQTVAFGTVKSVAPIGASLYVITFLEHNFPAHSTKSFRIGEVISIEILEVKDIEGKIHPVAFALQPRK